MGSSSSLTASVLSATYTYILQIFMDKSYKSYGHYADLGIELVDQEYNHKIQKKLEYTSQFLIYHQIDQNEYL